jgi:hypothetical protein
VSLAAAHEKAKKLLLEAKDGVNLLAHKRAQRIALIAAISRDKTFQECASKHMKVFASGHTKPVR